MAVAWEHESAAGPGDPVLFDTSIARDRATVARFFDGLELTEPGLVQVSDWRPPADSPIWGPAALWAGVARKPQC